MGKATAGRRRESVADWRIKEEMGDFLADFLTFGHGALAGMTDAEVKSP